MIDTSATNSLSLLTVGHTDIMKPRNIRCMKLFLALFNILCILFGLVLMAVCVINMRDRKSRPEQFGLSKGVLSFMLALGFGLVVAAVLGCIGALRENVKILYVHTCFSMFLVSLEVVVAVAGTLLNAWVGGGSELRVHFHKNATAVEDNTIALWDHIQSENQCCGVDGPQDYEMVHREIPPSCCPSTHPLREGGARRHLHANCITEISYYTRGCDEALRQSKTFKGKLFITMGLAFILIKILCIILAILMARTIKTERRRLQENLQAHFES